MDKERQECMFEQTAERVAAQVTNELAPSFRVPLRLVCPSREAEQAVLGAVTRAAQTRQIPVEVIDLEPDPAGRLNSLTSQLDDWDAIKSSSPHPTMPTLLILRGFDAFGDDRHEDPTYPFRSKFQFDEKFLWLFMGHDESRMRFLFESYRRPLYQAAVDITPAIWRSSIDVAEMRDDQEKPKKSCILDVITCRAGSGKASRVGAAKPR